MMSTPSAAAAADPVSPLLTPGRVEDVEMEVIGLRKVIKMQEEQLRLMYDEVAMREEAMRKALSAKAVIQGRHDACLSEVEGMKGKLWKAEQEKTGLLQQLERGRQELEELKEKIVVSERDVQRLVGVWKERLEGERGENAKREEALALEAERSRMESRRVQEKAEEQVRGGEG